MSDKSSLLPQDHIVDESSLRYMLKLASPAAITTISFTLMQFVDQYMVSRLGTDALAAIGPAQFVSFLPSGFAIGAMASLNTFVSQSLGRGDKKSCSNYFWQTMYMGFTYFLVVLAIMLPTAPLIFKMMGQEGMVAQMEVTYLSIMLYAHVLAVINWSANQFFMGIHRPIITMCASLCGQVVNVIANYVLIFGKLGFPAMGIAGAAWGTFVGIGVAALVNMVIFLSGRMNQVYQTRRSLEINFGRMYDLLKVGLPAGLGLSVNVAFWGMILYGLVGIFGKEAQAATTAVFNWTRFSVMPVVGISMALSAAVGKSIGAGKKELAVRQTSICLKVALLFMGLAGICFFVFREWLIGFWSRDYKVMEAGMGILVCAAFYQVFHAARIIYGGSLRGAGDTVWLMLVSSIGAVVILGIGGTIMVVFFPTAGPIGPWIAASLSIAGAGLANWWRFKSNRWMKIDLFKRRAVGVPVETEAVVE
ncbi:MAG: MATE family efflux transporter [Phycisphaerae bacterium]|nr:MATE family efflux transporter [Phycisphaerae bacterium]NIP52806.1 MATE family efflux transporter [Phycisphaerae bacterium]NIS51822.1 MATE family efflux transporter [Phycisphaerae bacterium]NIU09351.1 MATE family efflux transporter [Phycisphaerae bacterium]NIU57075.1 MATE family efflux transporter [Phycisphaerae bacterium]